VPLPGWIPPSGWFLTASEHIEQVIRDLRDDVPALELVEQVGVYRRGAETGPRRLPQMAPVLSLSPPWLTASRTPVRKSSALRAQ
jgi:hypothetical protein